ncbi:MAG TPA: tyrosine-protein phosphatase [Methanocorpusculum sp.]|nr:tyrosine-protein phosphatase [Methanocorpusculum sp.]
MKKNQLMLFAALAVLLCCVLACAGCVSSAPAGTGTPEPVPTIEIPPLWVTCGIYENDRFGTINLDILSEDFQALGFVPGDSVDITFSNGVVCKDVPFVTGVFEKSGTLILLARNVFNTTEIVKVNTGDEWNTLGVTENETVTVSLAEPQKYADYQKLNSLKYTRNRADFDSDEQFANFRASAGGTLKENYIYRGASPIDNTGNRVEIVNKLLEKTGVKTIIDLADTDEQIQQFQAAEGHNAPYFDKLYKDGHVIALGLSTAYQSKEFAEKLVEGLVKMTEAEGPFYIACLEGKNRTGFVALLLEALCGADYDETCRDYMLTYENYYRITKDKTPGLYNGVEEIKFHECLSSLMEKTGTTEPRAAAVAYLKEGGMTEQQIDALTKKISK